MGNNMLTADMLRQLLDYDPATGIFTWLTKPGDERYIRAWNTRHAGKRAGRDVPNKNGYLEIGIDYKLYLSHRLAWLYMTGEWPSDEIDHKDTNKSNNIWTNLREATGSQNGYNCIVRKNSKAGLKGVSICNGSQIMSSICVDGKSIYLGTFATAEEAHEAYKRAAEKYHGEFARVA